MSNKDDDTLKMPANDPADKARERIASLNDKHLNNDHPLLKSQKNEDTSAPKPAAETLGEQGKMHSPATRGHHGMPAEVVSNKRKVRPLPSKARPILSAIASFALLMLVFKSEVVLSQIKYLTGKSAPVEQTPAKATNAQVSSAPLITIPKIKVSAPIVYEPSMAEPDVQKALQRGVVHYGNTPEPGQPGNSVIVGHSSNDWWEPGKYKFVFVLLDKLVPGDKFSVNHKGKRYIYQVTQSKIVAPTDLSVLAPTAEPTMTLITCTPPGTSWKRLIIHAKQISPAPQIVHSGTPKALDTTIAKLPSNAPDFLGQIWGFFKGLLDKVASALS